MRHTLWLLYFLFSAQVWAGEVVLKNGDRLTGKIIRMDRSSLDLETELLGKVSVPSSAILRIESDTPLYVTTAENEAVKGFVSLRDGRFEVRASGKESMNYPKETVRAIRSEEEQHAFLSRPAAKAPGLLDLWGGSLDTAISVTRGNADTKTLNLGVRAARTSPRDNMRLYVMSIFSDSSVDGRSTHITEAIRSGSRYEINFSRRFFTFAFTDVEHDQFQGLDSRFVGGGGLGLHAIKNAKTSLQVFSGGSANHEAFNNGLKRRSREFVAGNDFSRQLTSTTSITESLVLYPNLSSRGDYRVTFDSSIVTRLNRWLAWHVTASNRYASNPAAGKKNDDLLVTTGLRFVHRGETLQNVEARPELRRK